MAFITESDTCKSTYEDVKMNKKHRYVIYRIRGDREIDVESIGDRNADYDQFIDDLRKAGPKECRFGLYDFEYTHQCQGTIGRSKKQKLFLMTWCPDTATIKNKMLYSMSYYSLKSIFVGVHKYIQATDLSEASLETIEEKLRAVDRR